MALSKGEYERIRKLEKLLKKDGSPAARAGLIANYQDTYGKAGKIIKGKWVRWDSRTNKKYDPKTAWKFINLERYGTESPQADLKYLRAKDLQIRKEEGPKYNDPLRRKFSRKLVIDDKNEFGTVYDKESSLKIKKDRTKLNELRKKTSFYRLNESAKNKEESDRATKVLNEEKVIEENPNPNFVDKDNQVSNRQVEKVKKVKEDNKAPMGLEEKLAWAVKKVPGSTLTRTGSVGGKNSIANNRARLLLRNQYG